MSRSTMGRCAYVLVVVVELERVAALAIPDRLDGHDRIRDEPFPVSVST